MIVKMYDTRIFFPSKGENWERAVRKLGELLGDGIHIENLVEPDSESINRAQARVDKANEALNILNNITPITDDKLKEDLLRWSTNSPELIIRNSINAQSVKAKAVEEISKCQAKKDWYIRWNTVFQRNDLLDLNKAGIYLKFYSGDEKSLGKIPKDKVIKSYLVSKNQYQVILISRYSSEILDGLKEDSPPTDSLNSINVCLERRTRQLEIAEEVLRTIVVEVNLLKDYLDFHENHLKERRTRYGMGQIDDVIPYMKCYIPVTQIEEVQDLVKENHWGITIMDVEEADNKVPTYIKNPKWIQSVDILLENAAPKYKEQLDYSFLFLVFYAVFAALLVGDGGYGLLVLATTFYLHKKKSKEITSGHYLGYILGGSITLWGLLTGTWFGYGGFAELPVLRSFIIPQMASFQNGNQLSVDSILSMMKLVFVIGAIQLSAGRLMSVVKYIKKKSWQGLSEVGWIINTWAILFVLLTLFSPTEGDLVLPDIVSQLFYAGLGCILVGKVITRELLSIPGEIWNGVQGIFQDLLSYIRLQVVGFVTVVLGFVFNLLAIMTGNIIAGIVIILIGHTLNIALAYLGFIVHANRLNLNEMASKCTELNGKRFSPFKFRDLRNQTL